MFQGEMKLTMNMGNRVHLYAAIDTLVKSVVHLGVDARPIQGVRGVSDQGQVGQINVDGLCILNTMRPLKSVLSYAELHGGHVHAIIETRTMHLTSLNQY